MTTISVPKAAAEGGALAMSRTYDRRGKLIQTTQRPAPAKITTSYFYDAAGSLTTILDTNQNPITATYDDLGRKLTVIDPDRGSWSYTWDGLSRLRTQTDARGILLAYQYDLANRLERRFVFRPGDANGLLEANWKYDLDKKGTLGALWGAVDVAQNPLTSAADYFHRDYKYDSLLRPWSV